MTVAADVTAAWLRAALGPFQSVSVVGNGPSVSTMRRGAEIDAADVVVRMNAFTIVEAATTGTRTDCFVSNMLSGRSVQELEQLGVRAVVGARPDSARHAFNVARPRLRRTYATLAARFPTALVAEADFDHLYDRLGLSPGLRDGRNPSTGLVITYLLATLLPTVTVTCYGFDFFARDRPFHYFADPVYNRVGATERVLRSLGLAADDGYDAWGSRDSGSNGLYPYLGYRGELQIGDQVDLRARNYDTTLGAFTTVDPLDGVNGTTTIAALYPYADNNPIRMTDPTGMSANDWNAFAAAWSAASAGRGLVHDSTGGTANDYYQLSQPVAMHLAKTTISASSGLTFETAYLAALHVYYNGNLGNSPLDSGCANEKPYLADCSPGAAMAYNVFVGDLCRQPGIRCSGYSSNMLVAGLVLNDVPVDDRSGLPRR